MEKPEKTLADYVAIALSPGLIMALVGSLVFFLLEILYVGQFYGSLKWVLFFFVFGAVLVSRISMQTETAERAPLYGLVLGGLMWLALQRYVEYPPGSPWASWGWALNLGLIALIWWSAHRLTRDCTLIDDEVDASGVGLLEVVGIEKPRETEAAQEAAPDKKKKTEKEPGGLRGWWQRYSKYREERKKRPHAPGVWVVYFSLAALPLFGLGQSQIPPDDGERRAYTFWLMCIYTGSGLGLLLATSFLGLRRYLRQRKLRMPAAMTGVWMALGLLLVAAFLFVGAMLPRPGDPVPLLEWVGVAGSAPRKASDFAQVGDPGQEKGRAGARKKGKAKKEDDKNEGGKSKDGKKKKLGEGKEEEPAGKKGEEREGGGGKRKTEQGRGGANDPEDDDEAGRHPPERSGDPPPLAGFWDLLAKLLKWIVIAALILVTAFFVVRGLLHFLANFTSWADRLLAALRRWWDKLNRDARPADDAVSAEVVAPPLPFSAFADPFASGAAARMPPAELVRYSFAALEAWGRQRHLGRDTGETPLEFVHRVSGEVPALEADVRRLGELYVGLAYARRSLNETSIEPLREFWHMLIAVHERPWSAAPAESLRIGGPEA